MLGYTQSGIIIGKDCNNASRITFLYAEYAKIRNIVLDQKEKMLFVCSK